MEVVTVDRARLSALETTIERGLGTFVEVGQALGEIREGRLYRESHSAFEDYCRERWGFNDRRASQLIQGAEVSTIVEVRNEGQARELLPLKDEPEKLVEVWREVSGSGTPTAEKVREVVKRYTAAPLVEAPDLGPRKRQQQESLIRSVVGRMDDIRRTIGEIDLPVAKQATPQERGDEWVSQLRDARTALSQLIAALG